MADSNEGYLETAEPEGFTCRHFIRHGFVVGARITELGIDHAEGQPCPVYGNIELRENEWETSYMIFVSVGENDPPDPLPVLEKERSIGNDKIYSKHLLIRKHEAAVNDHNIFTILKGKHVLPYLTQTTKRDKTKFIAARAFPAAPSARS